MKFLWMCFLFVFLGLIGAQAQNSNYDNFKPAVADAIYSELDVPLYTINAVEHFGANSSGTVDASGAIQQALNAASAMYGGIVFLPRGKYLLKNSLNIPTGVTLRGDWKRPTDQDKSVAGTILYVDHGAGSLTGASAIVLQSGSCVRDLSVYYPNQNVSAPITYPFSIKSQGTTTPNVRNITLVNSYQGISFTSEVRDDGSEIAIKSCLAHSVYGSPLSQGYYFHWDAGHSRLSDVDFSPSYWGESGLDGVTTQQVRDAIKGLKGVALSLGDAPGAHSIVGLRISGYDVGIHQFGNYGGRMFDFKITDCRIGLDHEVSHGIGFTITSGEIQATEKAVWMHTAKSSEHVQYNNVVFSSDGVIIDQSSGVLGLTKCTFDKWGSGYAVQSSNHAISLNGNVFNQSGKTISLGATLTKAVVFGNQFKNGISSIQKLSTSAEIVIDTTSIHPFEDLQLTSYPFIHKQKQPASIPSGRSRLFNIRDFGAKGTGLTGDDDTKAIQDALDSAGSVATSTAGAVVVVPNGAFRVKGRLTVPSFVELRGIQDYISFGDGASSILLLDAGKGEKDGEAIIKLASQSGLRSLYFFRPEQLFDEDQGINTIFPYPYAIEGTDRNWIYNLTLGNIYDGVNFTKGGGHHVNGLFACAINRVLEIGGAGETSVVENFSTKNDPVIVGRRGIVLPEWVNAFTIEGWRPPLASGVMPGMYQIGIGIITRGNGNFRFMGHFMNGTGVGAYEFYDSPKVSIICGGAELPDRAEVRGIFIKSDDNDSMMIEDVGGTLNNDLGAGFTISTTSKGDRFHRINCKGFPPDVQIGHTFSGSGHLVLQQEFRLGSHNVSLKLQDEATAIIESGWWAGNEANIAHVLAEGTSSQAKIVGTMAQRNTMWKYLPEDSSQICVQSVCPSGITGISGVEGQLCKEVTTCLPWSDADFTVSKQTVNYTSGAIDISCTTGVTISIDLEGLGDMEPQDSLYVYYKVNGEPLIAISENKGAFAKKTVSVNGINGSNLEIIIKAATSSDAEIFSISNMVVISDGPNIPVTKVDHSSTTLACIAMVYPNPVATTLYIDHAEGANIKIFNCQGQLIYNKNVPGINTNINVKSLNVNRLMVVKIIFEQNISTYKVMVK